MLPSGFCQCKLIHWKVAETECVSRLIAFSKRSQEGLSRATRHWFLQDPMGQCLRAEAPSQSPSSHALVLTAPAPIRHR